VAAPLVCVRLISTKTGLTACTLGASLDYAIPTVR
jgi:hypothetical protein